VVLMGVHLDKAWMSRGVGQVEIWITVCTR